MACKVAKRRDPDGGHRYDSISELSGKHHACIEQDKRRPLGWPEARLLLSNSMLKMARDFGTQMLHLVLKRSVDNVLNGGLLSRAEMIVDVKLKTTMQDGFSQFGEEASFPKPRSPRTIL